MKNYIIEVSSSFRLSDMQAFDKDVKGVEVMKECPALNSSSIWKVETSLSLSQMNLIRSVYRGGLLHD